MNAFHRQIVEEIEKSPKYPAGNHNGKLFDLNKYLGSPHRLFYLKSFDNQRIARQWSREHHDISWPDLEMLLSEMYRADSFEEKVIASYIQENLPQQRAKLPLSVLNKWLDCLVGWAEIDTIGTGPYLAQDLLDRWDEWKKFLAGLSKDANINKRRFSLVVLIIPVRESEDKRLADLAFANLDRLKGERAILITKAVSWLLRGLIKNHRERVEKYLKENNEILPKIAVREVSRKLSIGKK